MVSVSFGIISRDLPDRFVFRNRNWIHQVAGSEVTANVYFGRRRSIENVRIIDGRVIDFKIGLEKSVRDDPDGGSHIHRSVLPIPIEINFNIFQNIFIKTDKKEDMQMLLRNLDVVIGGTTSDVNLIHFDILRISTDNPNQWLAHIERNGNWSKGRLVGNDLVHDNIIGGNNYINFLKNNVGITTNYFDIPLRVQISEDGVITIYKDEDNDYLPTGNDIINYFLDELEQYAAIGRRPRRSRNS